MVVDKFKINLATIKDVQDFVNLMNCFPNTVNVYSGNYIVDGKSIMGLFSLNLSNPVTVEMVGEVNDKEFRLKDFIDMRG